MNSVQLNISDKLYPSLMNIFNTLPQDEIKIIEKKKYDFMVSSKKEIAKRIKKVEKSIANGDFFTEEEFDKQMDIFFQKLENENN